MLNACFSSLSALLIRQAPIYKNELKRNLSSFIVKRPENKNYVIFKFNIPPVNRLNLESLVELNKQLDAIENDQTIRGVILTSKVENTFSAGVDIMEMYNCETKRLENFWINVQDFWLKLYGSKKIYIAAINGHALALGCVIAMSCDYRIMADSDKLKIGLNAVHLGINAPFWFKNTMINTIGLRQCEKALQIGKIFTPKEALQIDLIDELVEPKHLIEKAEEQMKIWLRIPDVARASTKLSLRSETLNKLLSYRDNDVKDFIASTTDPVLQKNLGAYIESLKNKKK